MFESGITRDMFLVACNPDYKEKIDVNPYYAQIRSLVIACFAHLGKCTETEGNKDENLKEQQKKIREQAIFKTRKHLEDDTEINLDILLKFAASDDSMYQYRALCCLKDYIHSLPEDLESEEPNDHLPLENEKDKPKLADNHNLKDVI